MRSKSAGLKNVILLGKKKGAVKALQFLLKNNINVKLVVAKSDEPFNITLASTARSLNIPLIDEKKLYELIESGDKLVKNIDLVISYLFWGRIKQPLINLAKRGCINLHPAPLPDYKSRAGYNTALLDEREEFGVTAHFIDTEKFDDGPIIKVLKFPIDKERDNVISLEKKSQKKLFILFKQVMKLFLTEDRIPTALNKGGLYLTAKQLEEMKEIDPEKDSLKEIHKKIRAFFFPPYKGALINIKGEEFTLINNEILEYLAKLLNSKH